ncbi:MAG TPA: FIST N-terminal domain-containing protein [Gemmatirosa sp.]
MKLEQFQWTPSAGWDRPPQSAATGASAQLALLFGRGSLVAAQQVATLVRDAFPNAHLFGCSTGGEIHGTRVDDDTLTLTAVSFDHARIATARVTIADPADSFTAGAELVRQLDGEGLRHIVVVSDGLRVQSSALVRGIAAAVPEGVTVSGGFAADGDRFATTHVWCDGEPESAAAVALGFYGDRLRVGVSVTGGWGPFGPDRRVTKSRQNVLYELDGKPALALYKEYLGEYADGLPASGLLFPIEVRRTRDGGRFLRALLAVDEEAQSITFAGDVPEGAYARLMVGHIEDLLDSAQIAAEASRDGLGAPRAELSFVVSCNARRAVLRQRVEEEVEAVRDVLGATTAMTGFYSYGEIAPTHGGTDPELHNETMSITTFAEV